MSFYLLRSGGGGRVEKRSPAKGGRGGRGVKRGGRGGGRGGKKKNTIFRVVFAQFFRQICQENCRNFELDEDFD